MSGPGQNVGHGHVFPRPDGVRARCGGPALCRECARDLTRLGAAGPSTTAHEDQFRPDPSVSADWQDFVVRELRR